MTPIIFFAISLAVPLAVAYFLRVNAAILFMSLCVGAVLVQYVSGDSGSVLSMVSPHGNVSNTTVKIFLLFLPPALTSVFMLHSVHGHAKKLLNLIPAVGTGVLAAILVEPLLSFNMQVAIEGSKIWQQLSHAQAPAIAVSAFLSLALLWFQKHGSGKQSKHGTSAKKAE